MRERIQKVLAARGVGSRRQVESWIAAGRVTVNGKPAQPGQPVDERDDVRLDGRRVRLAGKGKDVQLGLAYHRPAQEGVRAGTDTAPSSLERLPQSAGRRWIPVSPLAAVDGGLELFVTDGRLAAALARRGHEISCEYSLRVRGDFDEPAVPRVMQAAAGDESAGSLTEVAIAGGEASNRWVHVRCVGLRPRDLKGLFERCGFEANRVLRTRFGPIAMDRALARGRSRPLTDGELRSLHEAAGIPFPQGEERRRAGRLKAGSRRTGR
ncbi:MAG: rRNA pseudouridine synthase [Steroidobacteraceae bacterium]|nr:rRNA pseudouridine synthase [Steroidobacteraceae bacterium]